MVDGLVVKHLCGGQSAVVDADGVDAAFVDAVEVEDEAFLNVLIDIAADRVRQEAT